jgi:transcription initiation factor TFIID subunit 10
MALAAQKFVADIAQDAAHYCNIRTATASSATTSSGTATTSKGGKGKGEKRIVLTMEDLGAALQEKGITVHKPDYYM